METTVQKWGNSYAVRLPRGSVRKLRLSAGRAVRITESKRGISITPLPEREASLTHLVSLITPANRHELTERGAPKGREVW